MGHTEDAPQRAAQDSAGGKLFTFLARAVPVLALAALLLHPTQLTVRQWADALTGAIGIGAGLAARVPSAHVTASDALFLVAFLVWLVLRWRDGTLRRHVLGYPVALAALFACALLSLIPLLKSSPIWAPVVMEPARGAKQLVQMFLFFVCAYVVLRDYLGEERWRASLVSVFLAAAAVALLIGLTEYLRLRPPSAEARAAGAVVSAMRVDGTFGFRGQAAGAHEQIGTAGNRNVFGAWLTLVLPLLWAVFLYERRRSLRLAALVLSLVGGALLLHGGLWAAALLAVLALSFARGRTVFLATAVGMLVFYGLLFALGPQKQGQVLLDSVMLRRTEDRFRSLPIYETDEELERSGAGARLDRPPYDYPWQQRYAEWQPALLAVARNPLFGVGLGNYQKNINRFYEDKAFGTYRMPKGSHNLMEPGGNAFYAVWLVETGLVGMLAFVWVLLSFWHRACPSAVPEGPMHVLKTGARAALGAMAVGCLFTDYWVRGVGIALAFVLALASCRAEAGEQKVAPDDEACI